MKKRIVSLCLAFALLLCLLPQFPLAVGAVDYSGVCGENLTWSFDPNTRTLTIEGSGAMTDYTGREAPWYRSFRTSIQTVLLPDELTSIGNYAFYECTCLTSVTIPDSVTSIGNSVFYNCTSLTSVTIPDSVTSIGNNAFAYCTGLTSVTIPDGVTSIGNYAFSYCTGLTSVTIPDSVTSIGEFAFSHCTSLTSVTIPDGVTSIGNYAFYRCTSLTSVSIPDSVTSIGEFAFSSCTGLTSVAIPEGVTTIGDRAFSTCTGLRTVTLPKTLTELGYDAFRGCSELKTLIVKNSDCLVRESVDYHDDSFEDLDLSAESMGIPSSTVIYGKHDAAREDADQVYTHGDAWYDNDYDDYYSDGDIDWRYVSIDFTNRYAENYAKVHGYSFFPTNAFRDVEEDSYYEIPVAWAVGMGITNGTGGGKFSPNKTCTREQVVTFLWRAYGCQEPETTVIPFTDVPADAYYAKAVLWAVEQGITTGKSKTKFGVGSPCTREQVVTFLWRAEGKPEPESTVNPFTDVSEESYAYKAVLWAVENGITKGISKTKFSPTNTCTRGQVVTFLYRDVVGEQ